MLLSAHGHDYSSQPQGRFYDEPVGPLSILDDVRSLELSILSKTHSEVVVESDADRRRARSLVSLFGLGFHSGLRRTRTGCAPRITVEQAYG
jgi:hypothetical protein